MLKPLAVLLFPSVLAAALVAGCASTEVKKSERWSSYPGCNAAQCRSWQEECSSECINAQSASVNECENKCSAKLAECESACPG